MIKMNLVCIPMLSLGLCGCALNPPNPEIQSQINQTLPTCNGADDCNTKWDATQIWITQNSKYRIRLANNVIIETFSIQGDAALAMTAQKIPVGNGVYQLKMSIYCSNIFGCVPNQHEALLRYNNYINSFNRSPDNATAKKQRIIDSLTNASNLRNKQIADSISNASATSNWISINIPDSLNTKIEAIKYNSIKLNEINDSASLISSRGFSCDIKQLMSGSHHISWDRIKFIQPKPFAGRNASSFTRKVYYDCVDKKAAMLEYHFYDSLGIEIPGGGYVPSAKIQDIPHESTMLPVLNAICQEVKQ